MPIVEPIPDTRTPLSQGDILKGVCLFSTRRTWEESGGDAKAYADSLCLVLSRPCVALRDEWVIVVPIAKYKNKPPSEFEDLDEAEEFYKEIRDGFITPDQMYLGQLPGYEGCHCAKFDSFHTVQIPKFGTPERQNFLAIKRVLRLHSDFTHDLHVRLVRAFASLGFDDHRWFSTEDLSVLIALAERDESKQRTALLEIEAKLKLGQTQGFQHDSQRKKLEEDAAKAKIDLETLLARSQPYKEELASRNRR